MSAVLLGVDLGTSSVKLLLRHADGRIEKAREAYGCETPDGWWAALCRAAKRMELGNVDAVGLSSQVGTYVVNGESVLPWSAPAGLEELNEIKGRFSQEMFLREISMPHPDIVSYPIPRLMHIRRMGDKLQSVCMPKDLLVERLTGGRLTDVYSWRGLADIESGAYSRFFLKEIGVEESLLPPLGSPTDRAGAVTAKAAAETGLREGTPVYLGCNDFFAGLAGAGVCRTGDLFDVTGTSEHIGGIADSPLPEGAMVSGPYFSGCVRYGVTGSSGASLNFARRLFAGRVDMERCRELKPPLFLPHLNGERCPVCDPDARGVFFGLDGSCDAEIMAYSVMEGVAFNLKRIYRQLGVSGPVMTVVGGAARDAALNQLKADVLGVPMKALDEPDASALGAAMIAGVASGEFAGLEAAFSACAGSFRMFEPRGDFDYTERFELHGRLYPILKDSFQRWRRLDAR